jgi:hypothetical protein
VFIARCVYSAVRTLSTTNYVQLLLFETNPTKIGIRRIGW